MSSNEYAFIERNKYDKGHKKICSFLGRILEGESIMWYRTNFNSTSFQNTSFQPIFTPTFTAAEEVHVQQLCGDDDNCRLDYAATRNDAIATATVLTSASNNETSSFVCELIT